jgi:flagellar assembly protein FliH
MMSRTFVPEDFDTIETGVVADLHPDPRDVEADRLSAFERGYKAGWDDSATALTAERKAISADFAANLGDLSFTYHEARSHVLRQLEELVTTTFAQILPEYARQVLPRVVWAQICAVAQDAASAPVTLLVAPGAQPLFDEILPKNPGFPLTIVEESTLTEGQVFIRSQKGEAAVDHATALAEIEAAVRQFFAAHEIDEEGMKNHG